MPSLDDIRREIDAIDRDIVDLVARRSERVLRLLDHKRTPDAIRVPEREEEVVANVRRMALEKGADPDVVERVYRAMIAAFVEYELRELELSAQRQGS